MPPSRRLAKTARANRDLRMVTSFAGPASRLLSANRSAEGTVLRWPRVPESGRRSSPGQDPFEGSRVPDRAGPMVVVEVDVAVRRAVESIDPRTQRRSAVARPGNCPSLMHTDIGPAGREPQGRDRPGPSVG